MWIMSENGFVSIVTKPNRPDTFVVRARDAKSLESFTAIDGGKIMRSPEGDYPYRVFVDHATMAEWFLRLGETATKYGNFKSRVAQTRPEMLPALHEVWGVMHDLEDAGAREELTDAEWAERNEFSQEVE